MLWDKQEGNEKPVASHWELYKGAAIALPLVMSSILCRYCAGVLSMVFTYYYVSHVLHFVSAYSIMKKKENNWISVHMWQSRVEIVDLLDIHASTKRIWAPPLTEVQRYGTLKAAMQSKYTTK